MIQLVSLTKAFGARVLFDQVTWQLDNRDRVGLTGPNGSGKTTLLRMLAGLEEIDSGQVVKPSGMKVGYLPQDGLSHAGRTLYDEASLAFEETLAIKAEIEALESRLGDASAGEDEHEPMLVRYADLRDRFRIADGYGIDLKIATVLSGLGFRREEFSNPTETFSGGWQMRIALARLLLAEPNLLLLDEPTNHLDLDARNWLEQYLASYPYSVILVSHDRYFLDAVVTRISEVNLRTLTDYAGNYSTYLAESRARLERLRQAKREQDEEVARMRIFIDRFRYKATKAAQVQSRLKALEKIVPIEVPPELKRVHFKFPSCAKSGRTVFEMKNVVKAYGETVVFKDLSLHIERGDRIALIGRNGSGKSTLMRMLSGEEGPDSGSRTFGHQVVIQYFAQDEATRLDPSLTVYETLAAGSPMHMVPQVRNLLGGFLFSGDDIYKRVSVLSGGERTRLAVAKMLLHPSNTLLLDEPTNHLDLDSKDVLLHALEDYGGTLIFVSHDRYFIDRLATKIIDIGGGDGVVFPGTYEEFLWRKQHPELLQPAAEPARAGSVARKGDGRSPGSSAAAAGGSQPSGRRDANRAAAAEERRRSLAEARKIARAARALEHRIADLEATITDREETIKRLEETIAAPGFYDDREQAEEVISRHQALMWEVGDLMRQWEELQTSPES